MFVLAEFILRLVELMMEPISFRSSWQSIMIDLYSSYVMYWVR